MSRRAAIYVRISRDRTGAGLGVARQRADCVALAAALGWIVVEVYVDNDISAYSGARRPAYERLLADVRAGRVDAVLAWHPDRLRRSPIELEPFIGVIESAGALVKTCTAGELDLSTPFGRMVARMLGAAARHEVEHAIERMRRKQEEMRAAGVCAGGPRPFGFERRLSAVCEAEATELRKAAAEVLVGTTPVEIARDWNSRGVRTARGRAWTGAAVCRVLTRPRNAAIVEHEGAEYGPAQWPAILDADTYQGVRAALGDGVTSRRAYRRSPKLLLSGIARCGYPVEGGGICGEPIIGAGSNKSGRRYRCSTGRHITRLAENLDQHIEDGILRWLPTAEAVEFLSAGSERGAELYGRAVAIRARLDGLGAAFADGDIDRRQLRVGTERANAELAGIEERMRVLSAGSALDGLAGQVDAAERWAALSVDRKRAVIDAVLTIVLNPSKRGGRGGTKFDTATVSVTPKQPPVAENEAG